jgi:hypothetical protein
VTQSEFPVKCRENNPTMPTNEKLLARALIVILFLTFPFAVAELQIARADQPLVGNETIQLDVGDSLVIHSDRLAIQQVVLQGNLSAATIQKSSQYPTDDFQINASVPGGYDLRVIFNQASDYRVTLYVRQNRTNAIGNSTSYYISGGSFELDVSAYFSPRPTQTVIQPPSTSASDGFANWMGSFGQAFPLWVKALYLLFGVQFLTVGGFWIRRESRRKEAETQPLDAGDKAYLLTDVAYKFLLASFAAIVAIMGGELVLLFILRSMFLVSIDLLSLWDLFVVGFAGGAVIIVYLIRFILEKAFDLKPFDDE